VAISGSGNSKNVLNALQVAREAGATTVGISGFQGGEMKSLCDICVIVPSITCKSSRTYISRWLIRFSDCLWPHIASHDDGFFRKLSRTQIRVRTSGANSTLLRIALNHLLLQNENPKPSILDIDRRFALGARGLGLAIALRYAGTSDAIDFKTRFRRTFS